ncbi:MAG: hypothetical protein OXS35_03210 [Dehalococcoidia bacterium]|nr:hypothetical protein [Dehalococcoidia bacterium]
MKTAQQHEQEWRDHIDAQPDGHQKKLEGVCFDVFQSMVEEARTEGMHGPIQSTCRSILYAAGKSGASYGGGYTDILDSRPSQISRFMANLSRVDRPWSVDAGLLCQDLIGGAPRATYNPLIMEPVKRTVTVDQVKPHLVTPVVEHPYLYCIYNRFELVVRYPNQTARYILASPGTPINLQDAGIEPAPELSVSIRLSNARPNGDELPRSYWPPGGPRGWQFLWDPKAEDETEAAPGA